MGSIMALLNQPTPSTYLGARAYRAVEFFSGIGSFSEAVRESNVCVAAAFDQSVHANLVFAANFPVPAIARNLDTVKPSDIPASDIWWLSPPCTPYTVRGKQRDDEDPRSLSLKNLLHVLDTLARGDASELLPGVVFLENVEGFARSAMHERLLITLDAAGYQVRESTLCSTDLGVPMLRPRFFITGVRKPFAVRDWQLKMHPQENLHLHNFVDADCENAPALLLKPEIVERYGETFDIVDCRDNDARAICFTSGYGKSVRASGSYLRLPNGSLRYFSPREILRLLGYREDFQLPHQLSLNQCWRLVGNAVDLRAIRLLLELVHDADSVFLDA